MLVWWSVALAADLALVIDGSAGSDGFTEAVTAEVVALSSGRDTTVETFYASFSTEGAEAALAQALASDARVVAAVGPLVSGVAVRRGASPKPLIAALVLDGTEPPDNVTVLRLDSPIERAKDDLRHIIGSDNVALALPSFLADVAQGIGPVVAYEIDGPPPAFDGVLLAGLSAVPADQRGPLLDAWTNAGVATLVMGGRTIPDHAMGALIDSGENHPISRRVALTAVDVLEGRTPRGGTVSFSRGELSLSTSVLERLEISPPFDVWAAAEMQGWRDGIEELSMDDAIASAVANSPELAGIEQRLASEGTAIATARSSWLPAAEATLGASQLDQAAASAFQPETSVQGKATATQLIWSDGAATNQRIQHDLAQARSAEWLAAQQDLAYDVGTAFVNLERAQAVIDVRSADIDRARSSLHVAQQRKKAGDASSAEVARWEAEVANARASLVAAWTDFRSGMIGLNQLRGVPVNEMVLPAGSDFNVGEAFAEQLDNPRALEAIATAASELSLARAPELTQLDNAKTAQERALKLSKRAYWMPTVAAQGALTWNLYQTPSDPVEIPGVGPIELANNPTAFWSVGASATVPLFSGGAKRADQQKASYDLASLEHQVAQIELALQARTLVAVNQAHGASWRAKLRREAAEAAQRSLDAALSAYAAGTATQTVVTEARTTALQLQLAATDATFETTLRILDLLRSTAALPTPDQPNAPFELRATLLERLETP